MPDTPPPSEAEAAEAKRLLLELAGALGRQAARAAHKARIQFDMDDPQVARDVLMATLESHFPAAQAAAKRLRRGRTPPT